MVDFHYRKKKINGEEALMINEILEHQAQYADAATLREKFRTEEINFINNLVDSGVFFYIDYHDTSLYDSGYKQLSIREQLKKSSSPVANIILSLYDTEAEVEAYADKWIKNGKLILAYDGDKAILHENVSRVTEINPILEKYFYTDTLLANNLRLQLTGFETNHPDKSKFTKMWGNVAKGIGIKNELIVNTTWVNEEGKIEDTGNIERLQKAQIIWGHSGLGKTTYLTAYPNSIIDWDNEFNPIRNEFIANTLGDNS